MKIDSGTCSAELGHVLFEWNLDAGTVHTVGRPAAMFWLDPSLLRMLQPLVHEVGAPLYRLLVAHQSSIGSNEDYQAFVTIFGSTFEQGFLNWGRAVGTVGWGSFELPLFDKATCRAVVRVRNTWEQRMQQSLDVAARWGCPFLFGKIVGIFSIALGVNCWAEERVIETSEESCLVEFHIFPSERTISTELEALRAARAEAARQPLEEKLALIEHQQEAMRAMATPILQVWEGVLALPIVGRLDSRRASEITTALLDTVVRTQARFAIIDLTGVEGIDGGTADRFSRIVRSIALLGAECLICGIRPAVAQALVSLTTSSWSARSFPTIQVALQTILATRR